MSEFVIYHNPKCSKSRATLALLTAHGIKPRIVEYLKTPPGPADIVALLARLGMKPEQLVRKGEESYKARLAGRHLSDAQWIEEMTRHPALIERPIVVRGEHAVIGRPPENVLSLIAGD